MVIQRHENQIEQVQKIFQMVNHDLRNPLLNVRAIIEELHFDIERAKTAFENRDQPTLADSLNTELPASLDMLKAAGNRMEDVLGGVGDLYQCMFAPLEPETLNMMDMFQRCASALGLQREGVVLHIEPLSDAVADPLAVKRIISEILGNARRAILASDASKKEIQISSEIQDGFVCFAVSDFGCGFEESELSRVFEPFFSGKAFGHGIGMGLTRARAMVEKHGGNITIGRVDEQTIVFFSLPSVQA